MSDALINTIDSCLDYDIATGKGGIWTIAGTIKIRQPYWYRAAVGGNTSGTLNGGPFALSLYRGHGASSGPVANATPHIALNNLLTLNFGTTVTRTTFRQRFYAWDTVTSAYVLHDSASDAAGYGVTPSTAVAYKDGQPGYTGWMMPIDSAIAYGGSPYWGIPEVSSPVYGMIMSAAGHSVRTDCAHSIIDTATLSPVTFNELKWNTLSGQPFFHKVWGLFTDPVSLTTSLVSSSYTESVSLIEFTSNFQIEIDMKEHMRSNGRSSVKYFDIPAFPYQANCSVGSTSLLVPVTAGSIAEPTAVMFSEVSANSIPYRGITELTWADTGLYPAVSTEFSNWTLAGTDTGDFTGFGATVSCSDGVTKHDLGGTAYKVSLPLTSTPSPVSATPGDPGYNVFGLSGVTIAPKPSLRLAVKEYWWDGTPFVRAGGDAEGVLISTRISSINADLDNLGSTVGLAAGWVLGWAGFYRPGSFHALYFNGAVTPTILFDSALVVNQSSSLPPGNGRIFVDSSGDSLQANGRTLGRLTLSYTPITLPSVSMAVASSSSDLTGHTTSHVAALGNWSMERFLQMNVSGVVLNGFDKATLTVVQAGGQQTIYTIRPSAGVALIDLTYPDDPSSPALGVGIGLVSPILNYSDTYNTPVVGDMATQIANALVSELILSVPGPSESCSISGLSFHRPTGVDVTVDPNGANTLSGRTDTYSGFFQILSEGKPGLTYPYNANLSGSPTASLQPTIQDLIDNLAAFGCGLSATYIEDYVVPTGMAYPFNINPQPASTNIPAGMVTAPDVWFGYVDYRPIPGSPATVVVDVLHEVEQIYCSLYIRHYNTSGIWIHGGGVQGIAYNRLTNRFVTGGPITIDHDVTVYPWNTGGSHKIAAETNEVGFFRSLSFLPTENVTIETMSSVPPSPLIKDRAFTYWPAIIWPATQLTQIQSQRPVGRAVVGNDGAGNLTMHGSHDLLRTVDAGVNFLADPNMRSVDSVSTHDNLFVFARNKALTYPGNVFASYSAEMYFPTGAAVRITDMSQISSPTTGMEPVLLKTPEESVYLICTGLHGGALIYSMIQIRIFGGTRFVDKFPTLTTEWPEIKKLNQYFTYAWAGDVLWIAAESGFDQAVYIYSTANRGVSVTRHTLSVLGVKKVGKPRIVIDSLGAAYIIYTQYPPKWVPGRNVNVGVIRSFDGLQTWLQCLLGAPGPTITDTDGGTAWVATTSTIDGGINWGEPSSVVLDIPDQYVGAYIDSQKLVLSYADAAGTIHVREFSVANDKFQSIDGGPF